MKRTDRKTLKRISIAAVLIIFSLILIEFFLRKTASYQESTNQNLPLPERFDAFTGYQNRDGRLYEISKSLNSLPSDFLRTHVLPQLKVEGPLVVVLGSDEGVELFQNKEGKGLAQLVKESLGKNAPQNLELVNISVRGSTHFQHYLYYLNQVRFLKPFVVVQLVGQSDSILAQYGYLERNFDTPFSEQSERDFNKELLYVPRGFFETIYFEISQFFTDLRRLARSSATHRFLNRHFFKKSPFTPFNYRFTSDPVSESPSTDQSKAALKLLNLATRADQIPLIRFILLPVGSDAKIDSPKYDSQVCRKYQMNLKKEFPGSTPIELDETDLYDSLHLSPQGRQKIADSISIEISKWIKGGSLQ